MNSFQQSVRQKMPAEISPGTASGRMMRVRICQRVAPSMSAHSSSSYGMVLKYPISSHVENGIRMVGQVRMRAKGVSKRPYSNTTVAGGRERIEGGTR